MRSREGFVRKNILAYAIFHVAYEIWKSAILSLAENWTRTGRKMRAERRGAFFCPHFSASSLISLFISRIAVWKLNLPEHFRLTVYGAEKTLDVFNLTRDARRRQALQELLSVALGDDPWVEDREHATVSRAAYQPSQPLFQRDDRRRDRVAVKAVSAVIIDVALAGADHGVGRHGERQLVDDHA